MKSPPSLNEVRATARCRNACENCKRRKERCNGQHPCVRCVKRRVEWQCQFSMRALPSKDLAPGQRLIRISEYTVNAENEDITLEPGDNVPPAVDANVDTVAPVPRLSRLVRHPNRKLIFLGDHANSSFLHSVRRVVKNTVGHCSFIDDPHRNRLVDGIEVAPLDWLQQGKDSLGVVEKPDLAAGRLLLEQYLYATSGLLSLLDQDEIKSRIPSWLEARPQINPPPLGQADEAKYYLVLALGAQASHERADETADAYFKLGRYLTMVHFMDKPSLTAVQCFLLITMFLVTASRRNAASMNLGIAVHAAHALGIHYGAVSELFKPEERQARENAWKSLRLLDVFLSGSLGRPLATTETRRVMDEEEESCCATVGLCWITERIMSNMYSRQRVSIAVVEQISKHHRRWASLLQDRLERDSLLTTGANGSDKERRANSLGLCHIQNEYHVSIMLLTRPFILEAAIKDSSARNGDANDKQFASPLDSDTIPPEQAFAFACVDSATRIIETLCPLVLRQGNTFPKRLPFVVNSVFLAGLVLGLAFFANMRRHFPLYECLGDALKLLEVFSKYDIVAQRGLSLLTNLETACRAHVSNLDRKERVSRHLLVTGLFGTFQPLQVAAGIGGQSNHHAAEGDAGAVAGEGQFGPRGSLGDSPHLNLDDSRHSGPDPSEGTSSPPVLSGFHVPLPMAFQHDNLQEEEDYTGGEEHLRTLMEGSHAVFNPNDMQWIQHGSLFSPNDTNQSSLMTQFWDAQNMFSLD